MLFALIFLYCVPYRFVGVFVARCVMWTSVGLSVTAVEVHCAAFPSIFPISSTHQHTIVWVTLHVHGSASPSSCTSSRTQTLASITLNTHQVE